jgi:hypothetical protein
MKLRDPLFVQLRLARLDAHQGEIGTWLHYDLSRTIEATHLLPPAEREPCRYRLITLGGGVLVAVGTAIGGV